MRRNEYGKMNEIYIQLIDQGLHKVDCSCILFFDLFLLFDCLLLFVITKFSKVGNEKAR